MKDAEQLALALSVERLPGNSKVLQTCSEKARDSVCILDSLNWGKVPIFHYILKIRTRLRKLTVSNLEKCSLNRSSIGVF